MLPSPSSSTRLPFILGIASFLVFVIFFYSTSDAPWKPINTFSYEIEPLRLDHALRTLYSPLIHPFDVPFDANGKTYDVGSPVIWSKPLRERLCIVDIDTRPMNGPNEIWAEDGSFDWKKLKGLSPGILNHYIYAQIHGYDYKFIHTSAYPDRAASWARLPALAALLSDYDFLIAIDSDVVFPHLHLPYEWLLNHWNITSSISVAMALEPTIQGWHGEKDTKNRQNDNDGFMTLQNIPSTHEMLRAWIDCPESGKYPGCENLKPKWPAEQGAFSEYIRYDFEDHIREFACTEGLGWDSWNEDCKGELVSHYTLFKDLAKDAVETALGQGLMHALQLDMISHKEDVLIERDSTGTSEKM